MRNEAIRVVEQAKLNGLYQRTATKAGFESSLSHEDVNDSYKKALIALQTKEQRRYTTSFDHIS